MEILKPSRFARDSIATGSWELIADGAASSAIITCCVAIENLHHHIQLLLRDFRRTGHLVS